MENYEKKYKEALERAKLILSGEGVPALPGMNVIEAIFPELAESEDEKIRKEIIIYLRSILSNKKYGDKFIEDWIAWLEKQGEHNNFIDKIQVGDQVTRNEDGVLVNLSQLKRIAKSIKKQGEQKPIKFKVGQTIKKEGFNLGFTIVKIEDGFYYNDVGDNFPFTDQDNWELVEQKPVKEQIFPKLTDEEEFYIVALEGLVKDRWRKAEQENDDFNVKKMSDLSFFLKTLKKPAWSEEDEETLDRIISNYKYFCKELSFKEGLTEVEKEVINKVDKEDIDWLKSLRPQSQWKTSDKQMEALDILQKLREE